MTSIVTALFLCVAVAGAVLAVVALPRLREGDRLLTPDGRTAVDDAARRARAMAAGRVPGVRTSESAGDAPVDVPADDPTADDPTTVDVRTSDAARRAGAPTLT